MSRADQTDGLGGFSRNTETLRRRRLQITSGRAERPGRDDAARNESPEPPRTVGPKLSAGQKRILIRTIAIYYSLDLVRQMLAEEYPGFPNISDDTIRYYRRKIDSGVVAEAEAARAEVLTTGLANKAVRVQALFDMVNQIRRVPVVESKNGVGPDGRLVVSYATRLDVSREFRELLKQIAMELGHPNMNPNTLLAALGSLDGTPNDVDDTTRAAEAARIRADLDELIRIKIERDAAEQAALAASQRPAARAQ